jgi:hypothetical protein
MMEIHRVRVLVPLAVGAIPVICTILIHGLTVLATVNFFRRERKRGYAGAGIWTDLPIVLTVIVFAFVAHLLEIGLWAWLFIIVGEFKEFGLAYYYSAVNYTTLGYGDVIMSSAWKLMGPLEAADGALMFGVSTAMIFAVIQRLLLTRYEDLRSVGLPKR